MDFNYDPFDAQVMRNPLPYYQILRDDHPLYYMPQWDTYALSRFEDIWGVLEVNDGTFVASEGTLPPTAVLANHNTGPVEDPPLHPLPFHAVFDADLYGEIRRSHSAPLRPRSVTGLAERIRALANERLDLLLPRGSFDLTQEYGGIVAASMVCGLLGLPDELAPQVLAAVNAGSLAEIGYFTTLKIAGASMDFGNVTDYWMQERPDHLVEFHVTLPLKTPTPITKFLTLRVADPEFFIDFEFDDKEPVKLVSAPTGCTANVAKPKPLEANDKQKLSESFFTNLAPGANFGFKMASAAIVACP